MNLMRHPKLKLKIIKLIKVKGLIRLTELIEVKKLEKLIEVDISTELLEVKQLVELIKLEKLKNKKKQIIITDGTRTKEVGIVEVN